MAAFIMIALLSAAQLMRRAIGHMKSLHRSGCGLCVYSVSRLRSISVMAAAARSISAICR